ncbi:ABC transporter ATP-binding protein [Paenibacillus sp. TRM 82003]|nr:ABC transporter ATP-binding protein [Paenibacillus sp. TRM 82003]
MSGEGGKKDGGIAAGRDAIRIEGLTKRYGEKVAVDGVTLEWRRGEVTALLGPNGAGKSTLVSMLLGLIRPTAGEVSAFGMKPGSRRFRESVGALLQEARPADGLKVREVLELFRSFYPQPLTLERLLSIAGLEAEATKRATALSGGQRRRLAFALALAGDPELVVLDEPTAGMDIESRDRFWDTIRELAAQGKTVLLTTHHLEEAERTADRVVVIDGGRIVADGTPEALKAAVTLRSVAFAAPEAPQDESFWSEAFPGVERVEREGGRIRLYAEDTDALLQALIRSAWNIRDIQVREATLEDAFRQMTKGA